MATTSTRPRRTGAPLRVHVTRTRMLAVAAATAAAFGVWVVTVPLAGVDLLVRPGGGAVQPVGAGAVVAVSLLAGLLGWALLALLERRTARAGAVWTVIALVTLLLSLGGPLTGATTTTAKAVLVLMHLAVAAVLIPVLGRSSPATGKEAA